MSREGRRGHVTSAAVTLVPFVWYNPAGTIRHVRTTRTRPTTYRLHLLAGGVVVALVGVAVAGVGASLALAVELIHRIDPPDVRPPTEGRGMNAMLRGGG